MRPEYYQHVKVPQQIIVNRHGVELLETPGVRSVSVYFSETIKWDGGADRRLFQGFYDVRSAS